MYEKEDKEDVAKAFHWQVLLAILNDELLVQHEAHGVNYELQGIETFLCKWWPQSPGQ
jgi:hypothetical protein